jgi:transcriptional regulator with XRE-family HTH domain
VELEKLKNKRQEKGYTRKRFAELLEINVYTYKAYECGYRPVRIEILKRAAELLECTVDDLI